MLSERKNFRAKCTEHGDHPNLQKQCETCRITLDASYNPLSSCFIHQLTCLDSRFDSEAAFLCRFSEWVERCLYLLADDLGSRARALAVCRAGGIDAGNLTRVLVGLRKLNRALLATLETALALCPRAVILQSDVRFLVHQASSPACYVITLPLRERWSSIKAQ